MPNLRVLGGVPAYAYSWPATALIYFNYAMDIPQANGSLYNYQYNTQCPGTLIDRTTVLISAQCIQTQTTVNNIVYDVAPNSYYPTYGSMYTVYLGVFNVNDIGSSTTAASFISNYSVSQVIMNPTFSTTTGKSDIGLLKLSTHAVLNEFVQIACLPNPATAYYPSVTNVSGWLNGVGDLYGNGTFPNVIYNTKLTVFDSTQCGGVFPTVAKDWNAQMCVGDLSGQGAGCTGDSGGALYVKVKINHAIKTIYQLKFLLNFISVKDKINGKVKYVAAGIFSYSDGCGGLNNPG
jgi:hypothetical protein